MINFLRVARQITDYKSLVVLNGEIPNKRFFSKIKVPIIAVDGGANKLFKIKVIPDLIVGDLDSYNNSFFPETSRVLLPDQNYSDFEKTITYLEKKQLTPSLVTGLGGGYLDHILYNFIVFQKSKSLALSANQIIFTLSEDKTLSLPKNTKISLFGYPDCKITTSGLKWELKDYSLSFFKNNSPLNRVAGKKLQITILKGIVLVIIYLLPIET